MGEVVPVVDSLGMSNGAVHDVVHGPQGDPIIEEVTQQLDHAAVRTMADPYQGQDQLPQPSLGDRQVEQDVIGRMRGSEGPAKSRLGSVGLVVEEFATDLVLPGQLGDRLRPGEDLNGQVSPLLWLESLGGPEASTGTGTSQPMGPAAEVGSHCVTARDEVV